MTVVTDGHADGACRGAIDRGAGVTRRVIALLVKARIVGDVNHPRAAEQRSVRVDHRRRVEGAVAVAFVEVDDHHDAQVAGGAGEAIRCRSGNGLSVLPGGGADRGTLRMKRLERKLRKRDQLGAGAGGLLEPSRPRRTFASLSVVIDCWTSAIFIRGSYDVSGLGSLGSGLSVSGLGSLVFRLWSLVGSVRGHR